MKLPRDLSGADIVKALQRLGFAAVRQQGSHVRLAKDGRHITVPMHRSVTVGTLHSILRQANISIEDFTRHL